MSVGIHLAPSSASRTVSPSRVLMSLTGCALSWLLPASKTTTPVTASGLAPQPPRVPPASPTRLLGPSDAGPATRIWCTSARLRRLCARPPVVWPTSFPGLFPFGGLGKREKPWERGCRLASVTRPALNTLTVLFFARYTVAVLLSPYSWVAEGSHRLLLKIYGAKPYQFEPTYRG